MSAHVAALCWTRYNQLRQLRPVVRSLSADATTTGLLQLTAVCRQRWTAAESTVGTERRCTSGHGRSKGWPADHATPVALTAGATAHRVQGHCLRLSSVFDWPGTCVPCWRLSPGVGVSCVCSSDVPTCVVPPMRTRFGDISYSPAGPYPPVERSSVDTTTSRSQLWLFNRRLKTAVVLFLGLGHGAWWRLCLYSSYMWALCICIV